MLFQPIVEQGRADTPRWWPRHKALVRLYLQGWELTSGGKLQYSRGGEWVLSSPVYSDPVTVSEHQLEYIAGWSQCPRPAAGLRTYLGGRHIRVLQGWHPSGVASWQARLVLCTTVQRHNSNLFLGFDLFSVIISCVKRSPSSRLILPFFL